MKKNEKAEQFFDMEELKTDLKDRSVWGGAVTMVAQGARFVLRMDTTGLAAVWFVCSKIEHPLIDQSGAWTPSNACDEALAYLKYGWNEITAGVVKKNWCHAGYANCTHLPTENGSSRAYWVDFYSIGMFPRVPR